MDILFISQQAPLWMAAAVTFSALAFGHYAGVWIAWRLGQG